MTQFQLGSISHGTLRTQDLLEAFANTLQQFNRTHPLLGEYLDIHANDAWDSDKAADLLNEGFFNALQEICPPFVHFGTLEGDGADFGFWPYMDGLRDATGDGSFEQVFGEHELSEHGIILNVTDHSEFVVMDLERNVIWSVV